MPENEVDLKKEMELIVPKLKIVLEAGYGEVIIHIQEQKIVYISYRIGEQIKSK